ncbi:hypothetical protein J4450_07775 [Candidatus Micrarchaeota archaeon]|nr:hypothetical protein [Candidatus Micrarchaeota archaeon]
MKRIALSHGLWALSTEPTKLAASDTFRRFKPEPTHEVRRQEVVGSRQEAIKRTREMLRSMTAEQLLQVIEFHKDLNLFEALALAKRENKLIVPNVIHDKILTETKDKKLLRKLYGGWKWTGTLVICEAPDRPFRKKVTFSWKDENSNIKYSVSFRVPKQLQGKANCALAIDHPDFEILEISKKSSTWSRIFDRSKSQIENQYELKLVEGGNVYLIELFPNKDGCYVPHPQTGIPQGEPVDDSDKARRLWRRDSAYISLLRRGDYGIINFDGSTLIDFRHSLPSFGLGVVLASLQ